MAEVGSRNTVQNFSADTAHQLHDWIIFVFGVGSQDDMPLINWRPE